MIAMGPLCSPGSGGSRGRCLLRPWTRLRREVLKIDRPLAEGFVSLTALFHQSLNIIAHGEEEESQ